MPDYTLKVGDKVRLTGDRWGISGPRRPNRGDVVTITRVGSEVGYFEHQPSGTWNTTVDADEDSTYFKNWGAERIDAEPNDRKPGELRVGDRVRFVRGSWRETMTGAEGTVTGLVETEAEGGPNRTYAKVKADDGSTWNAAIHEGENASWWFARQWPVELVTPATNQDNDGALTLKTGKGPIVTVGWNQGKDGMNVMLGVSGNHVPLTPDEQDVLMGMFLHAIEQNNVNSNSNKT